MRCHNARILIAKRQAETLDASEAANLEKHLASCSNCRAESEEVRKFDARLRAAVSSSASPALAVPRPETGQLLSRTQHSVRREILSWRRLALGSAAATFLIAALLVAVGRSNKRSNQAIAVAPRQNTGPAAIARHRPDNAGGTGLKDEPATAAFRPITRDGLRTADGSHRDELRVPAQSSPFVRQAEAIGVDRKPGIASFKPQQDDLAYLNPDVVASASGSAKRSSQNLAMLEAALRGRLRAGDDFVSVPVPSVAGGDQRAVQAAATAYQKEREIVDARLVRKVTLAEKGVSFSDLCRKLTSIAGIQLTANRRVADDKITVFCRERPLRDIMRQISSLFGFMWLRSGSEGAYEYELSQTLKSQLLEEALREQDRNEMLLEIDRQMEEYRRFLGLPFPQIKGLAKKKLAEGFKVKGAFEEYNRLNMLQHGGLAPANMFFRLSPAELGALRNGETLSWDLSNGEGRRLPPQTLAGLADSFKDMVSGPPTVTSKLTATLKLDMSQPGEYELQGELDTNGGGYRAALAHAKSPSRDSKRIDNDKENAALAHDPSLQERTSLRIKETCRVVRPPYPDTDLAYYEAQGPRVITSDVLDALAAKTGRDIIGDQFLRLHDPSKVNSENVSLFDALNRAGDGMQIRWSKTEGWLTFRTPDYYYARPQEVPKQLLEHWSDARKRRGYLGIEEMVEIGELSDAQLDSISTAQGAVGYYGLEEWQVARANQGRPHWRLLGQLSTEQQREAASERGLRFFSMNPAARRQFVKLCESSEAGLWPSQAEMRDARLRVLYTPLAAKNGKDALANRLLPNSAAVFLYSYSQPVCYSMIGPFNAIIGLSEPMLADRTKRSSFGTE